MKKIVYFLKGEKGETDKLVVLLVIFLLLSFFLAFIEPFIIRNKVSLLTKEVVEDVEFYGRVDRNYVNTLLVKYDLQKLNPTFDFTGAIHPSGKIQLRDEFTFKLSVTYHWKVANLGGAIQLPISISKTQSGRSQVYYRPSEL